MFDYVKKFFLVAFVFLFVGAGCAKQVAKAPDTSRPTTSTVTSSEENFNPAYYIPTVDPVITWPSEIPSNIPQFSAGNIIKFHDHTGEPPVSYQPDKILYILTIQNVPRSSIESYFAALKKSGWKFNYYGTMQEAVTGWQAEKDGYKVQVEDYVDGPTTIYYYIWAVGQGKVN
jgi:hypothetical protein